MATPRHIRVRGQAVRVLRGRTLQAYCLVWTGVYAGSPTDGRTRGRRVKGVKRRGQASSCACSHCMTFIFQEMEAQKVMAYR